MNDFPQIRDMLPGRTRNDARAFLARWIDGLKHESILDDVSDNDVRHLRAALAAYRPSSAAAPAPLPEPAHDLWRAIIEDGQLVAVMHAGPHWAHAFHAWRDGGAPLAHVGRFLCRCWGVHELAVHPTYRGRGYGAQLLRDAQAHALDHGVHTLSAHITTDHGLDLVASQGWTVLAPATPIPPWRTEGLRLNIDTVNAGGRVWSYYRLDEPSPAYPPFTTQEAL